MLFNNEKETSLEKNNKGNLFDPFFDDFFGINKFANSFNEAKNLMKTDVIENENEFLMEIDMPGFKKEDVSLELNNGYLTIAGESTTNNDEKDKKGNYVRRERSTSSCKRTFFVGEDITEDDIDASLENGTLKINVPKKKPQVVEKKKILIK